MPEQEGEEMDIDFYWDIGSTNTYFAFHLLRPLAAKYDAKINYVPFNLGYVFRHHGYALTQEPKAKMKNRKDDLMRWASRYQLPFRIPDQFPIKTSRVLKGAIVAQEHNVLMPFLDEIFSRYWEQNDATIGSDAGLHAIAQAIGISDPEIFVKEIDAQAARDTLVNATQTALDEGIFGAPTIRLGGEIYWGKDRFEFIESQLQALA